MVAVAIKLAGAGLAYLLVVSAAFVTNEIEFGYFATAWSLHTILSVIGLLGQNAVVSRFWAAWSALGDNRAANGHLALSAKLTSAGLVLTSGLLVLGSFLPPSGFAGAAWALLCVTTLALTCASAVAELVAGALRARGAIFWALAPRDVIWRALVILVLATVWGTYQKVGAVEIVAIAAALLAFVVLLQAVTLVSSVQREGVRSLSQTERADHLRATAGLWGVTTLPVVLGQLSTIIVAILLGPLWAGLFFAAERTSQLFGVAINGINQVLAPRVAAAYSERDMSALQKMASEAALMGSVAAVVFVAGLALVGEHVLTFFDPSFAGNTAWTVLLILSVGQAFAGLCGPVNIILQMTGHESGLLKILLLSGIVGLFLTGVLAATWGAVGAALATAATVILWNGIAVFYSRKAIAVDPSVIGVLSPNRHHVVR